MPQVQGELAVDTPRIVGVPRAPPVRDIPAQSPSVAVVDQVRSHGTGPYQVDAHDPVAGGQDSTAVAVLTAVAMLMATRNTYLGAGHEARAGCP